MEFKIRKSKIKLSLFILFLLLMLLCTIVSRGIYADALPRVSVAKPRNMSLSYQIVSEGVTIAERVSAINIEEGLVIKEVLVKEGDRVKEGDPIVKLNLDYLKDRIYDIKLSIKLLVIAMQDKELDDSVYSKEMKQLQVMKEQRQLDRYEKYLKQDGVITSDVAGVVMNISILAGEHTQDSAVIQIANVEQNLRFVTQITQSQRELINIGDTVEVNFGQIVLTDVVVSNIQDSDTSQNSYEVITEIPAQDLTIGKRGILRFNKISESYPLCVPIESIHSDGMQIFVFILNEGESILGEELRVEKRYVTILEHNENYVALDENSGISDNKVIISSSKLLEEGKQVRME